MEQEKDPLQALQNDIKYMGFGEHTMLNLMVEEQVRSQVAAFEAYTEAFFDEETKIEARLFFRKGTSDTYGERYYFNRYEALLRYSGHPEKDKKQTFSLIAGRGITFKEAFNLLQGRWVCKTVVDFNGEKHTRWFRLDFSGKTQKGNYYLKPYRGNFDLEKTVNSCPIRELEIEEMKERIYYNLRKGNLYEVHYRHKNGKYEKKLITADPEARLIKNFPVATWADRKVSDEPGDPGEMVAAESEEISGSVLQDDLANPIQKAHL